MARKKKIIEASEDKRSEETVEHFCFFEMKIKPKPLWQIEKLAKELIEWAKNDDQALKVQQFIAKQNIRMEDWYKWIDKCPALKDAWAVAKMHIGNRRELGAITGKYQANTIMPFMGMFDADHKEFYAWKASLQSKNQEQAGSKIVVIERYPDSEIVPKKEEVENMIASDSSSKE